MKRSGNKLVARLLAGMGDALMGIVYVHRLGISPLEVDSLLGLVPPTARETHRTAGVADLKPGEQSANLSTERA